MTGPTLLPIKLQPSNVRPVAYRVLSKKHGLNLQSDALVVLAELFSTRFGAEWRGPRAQQFLEELAKQWKKQARGLFIDGPGEPPQALDWRHFVRFVTPDTQPNFEFDRVRRQFSPREAAGRRLRPTLRAATDHLRQRYFLMCDRMSRDDSFQKTSFSSVAALSHAGAAPARPELTLVKNVLGRDGSRFRLFGLLARNASGDLVLEDSSDRIELAVARAAQAPGSFFCPGMFVIADGIYAAAGGRRHSAADEISGCFHVSVLSQPVAEPRDAALDAYGHLDFMGMHLESPGTPPGLPGTLARAPGKIDRALRRRLAAVERTLHGHRLVLADCNVHLDEPRVRAALSRLFAVLEEQLGDEQAAAGAAGATHVTVVLAGSFCSQALTPATGSVTAEARSDAYKAGFDWMAQMLAACPLVVRTCTVVLVPGARDPWQSTFSLGRPGGGTLPQTPVPRVFVTRLERLLPRGSLVLGWNPMRVNYVSQEIVLFRDDVMAKLKRSDLALAAAAGPDAPPDPAPPLLPKVRQARVLVKTLLDQGSLQPLLRGLRAVSPAYQHAMRLEPLPTTVALFDAQFEPFDVTYNGCKTANVGAFISNHNVRTAHYTEYSPSTKRYTHKELLF
ncbi:hypothetical protein METBIDRAFT_78689 [Metschnikowia bicuspidata var. bicuspidata NRRL YB-4993]|uniref:DNA polymerase epsilon subunit B n=1 Tax=Metschnikowia bicuspidata var. bicuspidata NRRL YB-4993 TaxID=869754 RepID=A0A1A0H817_9ASCO|nr:hypothetical protein METBIDRAFT_78689 [Metschnikowia bicuspidata var. bicuspidata NRRL YB-4993]OBA20244.1 hypothetical protein METBIDRAFT_78689 [Metschnikowia bicuspidata var. bicuspidata NRRL YB-4993]